MRNLVFIILGSVLVAAAFNLFFIPHNILSGGLSGIAILLGIVTPINTGILNLILNLPLLIIGIFKLGKRFISYTILSVIVLSISLYVIPVHETSTDPFLSCLFGGVLSGLGSGVIFRASGSSGGFDILAMLLTKKRDFPLGTLLAAMNAVVVIISGFVFGWNEALLTLVGIYAGGKVIDTIHTNHVKLTLMIVTKKGDELKQNLLSNLYRGMTIIDGEGAYSGAKQKILMTVITRYQLTDVKTIINEVDPNAFVNITQTTEVIGFFHKG